MSLTPKEQTALAMLRAGLSYHEAAERNGLTVEKTMQLWFEHSPSQTSSDKRAEQL